jgi:hypothetical protein
MSKPSELSGLPWTYRSSPDYDISDDAGELVCADIQTDEDGEYIVTACNAFPDLLEAVNLLLAAIAFAGVNKHPAIEACLDYAAGAVTKAKGEDQ